MTPGTTLFESVTTRTRGLSVERVGGWTVFETSGEGPVTGSPGLWRPVPNGRADRRLFEVPPRVAATAEAEEDARAVATWARATARGLLPEGWELPDREEVLRGLDGVALVARAGPRAVEGSLVHEAPSRIALRFPEVVRVPEDLPDARLAWLDAIVADARRRFRLVRLDRIEGAVRAEVDLSGAPRGILEALLPAARDALCFVVAWSLPSLHLVADASLPSQVLARPPSRGESRGKES